MHGACASHVVRRVYAVCQIGVKRYLFNVWNLIDFTNYFVFMIQLSVPLPSHRLVPRFSLRCHICSGTGPTARLFVSPGLGSPPPHLHRDWAWPRHICTGTGLGPATSAPGLGSACLISTANRQLNYLTPSSCARTPTGARSTST